MALRPASVIGIALLSTQRIIVRILAAAGIILGANWILFNLTARCGIRANQPQFVMAQMSLQGFGKALERYRTDLGGYPSLRQGLQALVVDPVIKGWNGPYTTQLLIDPWGRPYLYEISNGVPVVRSLGADGKPGGDWYDSDLSSQNPLALPRESKFHAAQQFFQVRVAPWLVLTASLYAWFRFRPRRDAAASERNDR